MTETPEQPNGQTLPLAAELKPLPDELIVDSDDLAVVLGALRELKTDWAEVVEDTRLGLARLTGVTRLAGEVADLPAQLRAAFATSAGGWQPEVDLHWSTLGSIGSAGSKPMSAGPIEPAGSKPMGAGAIAPAGSKPMGGIGPIVVEPAGSKPMGTGAIGTDGSKPMTVGDPMDAGPVDQPAADAMTGAGVAVAMIDTPLFRHPVFTGRDVSTREWHTKGTTLLTTRAGHGTFVCSVILGHAPAARIEADGALDSATSEATEWEVAQEIVRLGDRADILNLSLASHTLDGAPSLVLRRAVDRLPRRVLVIAAAGNHGETADPLLTGTTPMWPAALPGVVAVGAMDRDGIRLPFSPDAPWVSCQAVGFEVRGAYPGGWAKWTGTSFAAAWVTGMVAARTVPGRVSPAEAFELVLDDPDSGVERYAPLVWAVCGRHRLSGADADDVGAAVWLRLVEQLGRLREPAALPGWLATTTRHECLRLLRAKLRQIPVEDDPFPDEAVAAADEWLLAEERRLALRRGFATLPERCRRLLEMLFDDPPVAYARISEQLGMAVGGIGPNRLRCLGLLRRSPPVAALAPTTAGA